MEDNNLEVERHHFEMKRGMSQIHNDFRALVVVLILFSIGGLIYAFTSGRSEGSSNENMTPSGEEAQALEHVADNLTMSNSILADFYVKETQSNQFELSVIPKECTEATKIEMLFDDIVVSFYRVKGTSKYTANITLEGASNQEEETTTEKGGSDTSKLSSTTDISGYSGMVIITNGKNNQSEKVNFSDYDIYYLSK